MYGKGLYASRCAPCHGNFDGKGFAASGFTPPPANFKDPTTIAMLQESYLFWRIKREASAFLSKGCHGRRPCRDGSWKCPMRTSGKSSWASMTEPDRNLEPGMNPNNVSDQRLLSN